MSVRASIFQMSIPYDKTFPWVPTFFTLWPWPWSLTYFLKTLTLLITFEQWVLKLWYFKWVYFVTRLSVGTKIFYLVTLTLEFDLFSKNFNYAIYFSTMNARALIFHMITSILCDKTFPWVPTFFTLWPWLWSLTYFLKTLTLQITYEQ